jgi:uncharacterized protein YdeI (BOF family)
MKKIILAAATIFLVSAMTFAQDNGKCGMKCDKKHDKKECSKDAKCDKKCGMGECTAEMKCNKDNKKDCAKHCKAAEEKKDVKTPEAK